MPIDPKWLRFVTACADLSTRDTFEVDGVEIELPRPNARGHDRVRDWQRRVLPDLVPDSVQADAPERTPFKLLYALTTGTKTARSMAEVFDGEFAPMADLFLAQTVARRKMTLAFHVLAVKAAEKGESDAKGYTDRTLVLLCRDEHGVLDAKLLEDLVAQFRRDPSTLDLAQRTVLEAVQPGWTSGDEPRFHLTDSARVPEVPFDPSAARLFREDLRTLLGAGLPPADFFQQLNLLLTLHLGLYQPRVAALLNPQMEALLAELASPDPRHLPELEERLQQFGVRHPFTATLSCRAPDPDLRAVTLDTPARLSFEELARNLANFHFNVLLLGQLRRLAEAYLAHRWDHHAAWRTGALDAETQRELARQVRGPGDFLARMANDPDFATFLHRATVVLAVRFAHQQIADSARDEAMKAISIAPSGLHALLGMYGRYNIQNSKNATASRAYRQGIQITSSLLNQGEYGLVQGRQRVGPFFQVGAGILPLLLLLSVGAGHQKAPVDRLWSRLEGYGLSFDRDEQERLLARLRAMGVYERFSDAGEAAYVRNLMTSKVA
jgi:hypothetical protein